MDSIHKVQTLESLKINFADMWSDFDKTNNFFYQILSQRYQLEISKDPQLLIYSCFGYDHMNYHCAKLFYTAENLKTNFDGCDYSISFENLNSDKQYHLPYYAIRVLEANSLSKLEKIYDKQEAQLILNEKEEFCCTVVSNPNATIRNDFFYQLNKVKKVNSGGRFNNNIGGPTSDKRSFCKSHKFVFAFENEKENGYCTEKITDAFLSDAIPIYFGDPTVTEVFNSRRFINYDDFADKEELVQTILDIDSNDEKFIEIITEPVFKNAQTPSFFNTVELLDFISKCVDDSKVNAPVSKTYRKYKYWIFLKFKNVKRKIRKLFQSFNKRAS
jgi:hypothetical protein